MKIAEILQKGRKYEQFLLFFSYSVFERLVLQTDKNQDLFEKGLKGVYKIILLTGLTSYSQCERREEATVGTENSQSSLRQISNS